IVDLAKPDLNSSCELCPARVRGHAFCGSVIESTAQLAFEILGGSMKRGLRDLEEARCCIERLTFINSQQATNLRLGDLVGHVQRFPAHGRIADDQRAKSGAHVVEEALHAGQQYGAEPRRVTPGVL